MLLGKFVSFGMIELQTVFLVDWRYLRYNAGRTSERTLNAEQTITMPGAHPLFHRDSAGGDAQP
jgi:hypothetical protein